MTVGQLYEIMRQRGLEVGVKGGGGGGGWKGGEEVTLEKCAQGFLVRETRANIQQTLAKNPDCV